MLVPLAVEEEFCLFWPMNLSVNAASAVARGESMCKLPLRVSVGDLSRFVPRRYERFTLRVRYSGR